MNNSGADMRYWGWGTLDKKYPPEKSRRFLDLLAREFGLPQAERAHAPKPLETFKVPPADLGRSFVSRWRGKGLSVENADRVLHACGKSYRDLLRLRAGELPRYPDAVLHLRASAELEDFFKDAAAEGISCVPFGGGTGVVGGTECLGQNGRPVVVIDTKGLNRALDFDAVSRTAAFEAGILGPDLERHLNGRGMTLGHFPQSFEFSTLGGWIATRSAGQNSTKYGKIENMVQSLTLCSPSGRLVTRAVPASATGPSLKDLLVGSEGIYGIITEAVLRVRELPEAERFLPAYFPSFENGAACVREMMQTGVVPSIVRLSDAAETALLTELSLHSAFERFAAPLWLRLRGLGDSPCFMLSAFEGRRGEVAANAAEGARLIRKHGGAALSKSVGAKWRRERFDLPYLRDDLMDRGCFIDTLETAAPWSKLHAIHAAVREAFAPARFGGKILLGSHLSHAYPDGASLYFTFIGAQERGDEIAQWEKIKTAATEALVKNGGALSHHHGIGYDHRRWMKDEHSALALKIFRDVKKSLDPEGLLNPDKVI